ncbi:MAG: hypothetical protein HZA51_15640 [Planctomycetes bacterium]|nr:hypothetical protein [Planctomycetota bacterium]
MPLAITIELVGDAARLSQRESTTPNSKTHVVVIPPASAAAVKAWFVTPAASTTVSDVALECLDCGVRVMQTVYIDGRCEKRPIILTPAQFTTIKAWMALWGTTTAPESPLVVNP